MRPTRIVLSALPAALTATLVGACAGGPALPDTVRGLAGLGPARPAQPAVRNVALHLNANNRLNVEKHGQPLALVVRVYTLRQRTAFDAAPYTAFLAPDTERLVLGADLVDVREMTLVPGQRVDATQPLAGDAGFIGVVALFHTPAPRGWRLSVAASEVERGGLALELGACAMARAADPSSALVRCQ